MLSTYQRLNVHVAAPAIAVVRAARMCISRKHRNSPEKRKERKAFYKEMLRYHEQEREFYLYVYQGV